MLDVRWLNNVFHLPSSIIHLFFPRPVVLIGLLGTGRHLLLTQTLTVFQSGIFSLTLLGSHRLLKDGIVQIHQVLFTTAGGIHHPLQVMSTSVHLQLQDGGYTHLILQNRRARHTSTHQMPTATDATLQHYQTYLLLLRENELLGGLAVLLVIAVHIVEKEAAYALTPCQGTIHLSEVIRQLQQLSLGLAVTLLGFGLTLNVHLRITQGHQLLAVLNTAGHLLLAPAVVYH